MTVLLVRHITRYRYRQPVSFGEHRMMLRPRESYDQRLVESRLTITPEPTDFRQVQDVFGNCVAIAQFEGEARELTFESEFRLEHDPAPLPQGADTSPYPFAYPADDLPDLASSMERHWPDPDGVVTTWAEGFAREHGKHGALALLSAMTRGIHRDFSYARRLERGLKAPVETLHERSGACRDYALLMMEGVRALGFAARFVSGYIYTPPVDGGWVGGGHTHAWVRVYLPCSGWVEFDPTNGIVGGQDLIRVAIARDPRQAVPLHGTWFGSAGDFLAMDVEVDVRIAAEREADLRVAC